MAEHAFIDGEVLFTFEKSNQFRVLHIDGAIGGAAPGQIAIHMAVYSERAPIPKTVVHTISNGMIGSEIIEKRTVKEGIYREVEADLVMTPEVAASIAGWLLERVKEINELRVIAVNRNSQNV